MRRVLASLLVIGLLVAAWFILFDPTGAAPIAGSRQPAADAPREPAPELSASAGTGVEEVALEPPAERVEREQVDAAEWDPDARKDLTVRVVDEHGGPVAGATVRYWALRSKQEPGSHSLWRGEEPSGTTDQNGEVRMWYPVWVSRRNETSIVTVRVEHPWFVTKSDDVTIEPGEHVIVVEYGSFVTVSGFIGSEDNVVTAVEPHVTWEARVSLDDWLRPEGRPPSTHKMAFGHHALYLAHDRPDGRWYSDFVEFDLAKGDRCDLRLELKKALRLSGRLDDSVPRPVQNGEVMLNLWIARGPARGGRPFTAAVAQDGTFEFPALPPGSGEIIGLCAGFVSAEVPVAEGAGSDAGPDAGSPGETGLQRVAIEADTEGFVLKMRKAATFVAEVVGPDDAPVAGATVVLWPNVHWGHGAAQYFMEREYVAQTDAAGVATITELPPGREGYAASADGLGMPLRPQSYGPPDRNGEIELKSGETHTVAIRLEKLPK